MTTHFPTVPVDGALRSAHASNTSRIRPLALVADDDPMITATLCAILNVSGLAAISAQDGFRALEVARIIPPEILIADLVLPGLNGLDLAARVTRATPDCEVILFVDSGSVAGLNSLMGGPGFNFRLLFKPVHPADLVQAVFGLLAPHGHVLTLARERAAHSPYDLLTAIRPDPDGMPVGLNVTRRRRAADSL